MSPLHLSPHNPLKLSPTAGTQTASFLEFFSPPRKTSPNKKKHEDKKVLDEDNLEKIVKIIVNICGN